ncbi:MAG: hypothetical protein FWF24_00625 [Alphaproteobacteria bacterium]|nr:hypothetical protein [Alphaproteobacteria bacterium]
MKNDTQSQAKLPALIARALCLGFMMFLFTPAIGGFLLSNPAFAQSDAYQQAGDQMMADALGLATDEECKQLMEQINRGRAAYNIASIEAQNTAMEQVLIANAENPIKLHPPVRERFCLDNIFASFDAARALLSGKNLLGTILAQFDGLLNQACNWIASNIKTAVQNGLDAICIPISLPSFNLSLPTSSLSRKGCNGVSLSSVLSIDVRAGRPNYFRWPRQYMDGAVARWVDDNRDTLGPYGRGISGPRF